ncbi:MAG: ABC transporter permease [Kiritimatiellae bacterium]|nr:ABC transporter permease [Kiritimatiellia bacterium]MDD4736974.1 ABC transporter permease [Kiritimatiellia bacterium]
MKIGSFYLEKRTHVRWYIQGLSILIALLGAFGVGALLIKTTGANVGEAYAALFKGAFGSRNAFLETLVQSTPLILTGLAMVVAFRARVWNIGAEGQFFAGAMAAAWVSMSLHDTLPYPLLLAAVLGSAMVAGACWSLIAAYCKIRFNANIIIVTVMMNYIILFLLSYLLSNTWREPGSYFMQTARFERITYLPRFFSSRLHLGFFNALIAAALVYLIVWKTSLGYSIRAVGVNPVASQFKGIQIKRTILTVMLISGALAGLAGGGEIAGLQHRLRLDISTGYGYTGIIIALLGRLNPVGVALAAIFFGALVNGSTHMQIFTGVPVALVQSLQGIVLIFLLMSDVLTRYRIRRMPHAD